MFSMITDAKATKQNTELSRANLGNLRFVSVEQTNDLPSLISCFFQQCVQYFRERCKSPILTSGQLFKFF